MKTLSVVNHAALARRVLALGLAALLGAGLPAWAGPGAHGPNGEHLDAPAAAAGGSLPRVEASTDLFELVGQLHEAGLVLLIDLYASNEPLLGAQVEVEAAGLKAVARFDAGRGDYTVDDAPLLALLRQSGEHALLFTIVKGQDSDLLDGTLSPAGRAALADDHASDWGVGRWLATVLGLGGLGAGAVWFIRRRRARAALPTLGAHV